MLDAGKIKNVYRLGKPPAKEDSQKSGIPRPLKVILEDETTKNELLKRAKYLKTTCFKKVSIVADQTVKERELTRALVKEKVLRRIKGEDLIIYQGKLVPRRKNNSSSNTEA